MKISNIYFKEADNYLYIEKGGKLYRTAVSPFRAIQENELKEISSPLPLALYIKANHLFEPSESFYEYDLKSYGLEIEAL